MTGRGSQERHHTVRIMTTMPVLVSLSTSVSLLVPVDGFVFCFLFFFLSFFCFSHSPVTVLHTSQKRHFFLSFLGEENGGSPKWRRRRASKRDRAKSRQSGLRPTTIAQHRSKAVPGSGQRA